MRVHICIVVAFLHLVLAVAAHAQSTEPPDPNRCYPIAPARVDVRLKDGTTTRGTIVFKSLLRTYSALSRRASYLRERQATD